MKVGNDFPTFTFIILPILLYFCGIMQPEENFLYSPAVLDFVRVSTEYCRCLEQCGDMDRTTFCRTMRALLPMVYLKATMMPDVPEAEGWNEPQLTEEDYDFVRHAVARVMADQDDFLDVFVEDFKYSEQPLLCTISENLADVYQMLRELAATFQEEHPEAMTVALYDTMEEFRLQWGQKLLGALRALHELPHQTD